MAVCIACPQTEAAPMRALVFWFQAPWAALIAPIARSGSVERRAVHLQRGGKTR